MKKLFITVITVLFSLVIISICSYASATNEDDNSNEGQSINSQPVQQLNDALATGEPGTVKWAFQTGTDLWSSPAIGAGDTIYVGSDNNRLYAINPDGTVKWSFLTGGVVNSSPAIGTDGTIYVGSYDGKLYAINPNGTKKWVFPGLYSQAIGSSPAIGADGTIYVRSTRHVFAINPDGTQKWAFESYSWCLDEKITSSPAIGLDGTIYVGSCTWDRLHAINPDGTEKWYFQAGDEIQGSPAIGSDGTIYVGSKDSKLYAINPDGTQKWAFQASDPIYSSPAIDDDGTIYVGCKATTGNKFHAVNPDGTEKWAFLLSRGSVSSPAIGSDGTIYVGGWDDRLFAFNPDGSLKWAFVVSPSGLGSMSSPAIGNDGTIYVGLANKLYAIYSDSPGLANTPWPMFRHDLNHTGRYLSPPSAPSSLVAKVTLSSSIALTWKYNSTDETGFKIERKTGAGGTYSLIATVGANIKAYSDTGLSPNTTYYYRVRAYNAAGNSSYSNEASATTQALSVNPPLVNFGSVNVEKSSIKTVTVTNTGTADLTMGTIEITGTDAFEFIILNDTCSGQAIAPSGTCILDVMFSPKSETPEKFSMEEYFRQSISLLTPKSYKQKKSAILNIPSNDPDTPVLEVPLTGKGYSSMMQRIFDLQKFWQRSLFPSGGR